MFGCFYTAISVVLSRGCFSILTRPPPTSTLFPYTTLFRSRLAPLRRDHDDHRRERGDGAAARRRGGDLLRHLDRVQRRRGAEARTPPPGARADRDDGERHRSALLHHRAVRRGQARGNPRARPPDGPPGARGARPVSGGLGAPPLNPGEYDFVAARRRLEDKPKSAGPKLTSLDDAVARIRDGDQVAVGGCLFSRTPMPLVLDLLRLPRRGPTLARNLTCTEGEFLMVAGAVARIVTAWMSIGLPWGVSKILRHF